MGQALSLAEVLQQFRTQRGMSKRSLSQAADLSPSYVGKLEAGEIEPSLRAFLQIVHALKLSQAETTFCIRCAILEYFPPTITSETCSRNTLWASFR